MTKVKGSTPQNNNSVNTVRHHHLHQDPNRHKIIALHKQQVIFLLKHILIQLV
jgi:hypothetical protein